MKNRGLIQPNILIRFNDFGFDSMPDIQNLIRRFDRLELVYLALEIIYDRKLSSGCREICSRLFPKDKGATILRLLDKELNTTYEDIATHHLVCMQTGLELLKILLSNSEQHTPWDFDTIPKGAEIKGTNLFTILLLVNERITKELNVGDNYANSDLDTAKDIIANGIATTLVENSDYTNFDILTTPLLYVYKSTLFLEFCASHKELAPCLNKVLEKYGCTDIRTFITVICGLFVESHNSKNNYCRFVFSENDPAPTFFNELSFPINTPIEETKNVDYSYFRAYPLIRVSDFEYIVICLPFLFGKLYHSLIFDLSEALGNGDRVRRIISTDFSEQILLFPLLKKAVYPKSPFSYSGAECDKIQKESAPDFYVRNWASCFLFELKDYSFRAKEKTSLSYEVISKYLYTQFVEKSNGRAGAIKQLATNVKALIDGNFIWDTKARPKRIYPLLVLGNQNYLNYGITYILNRFFSKELQRQGIMSNSIA
ncbi:MAG: hypothetical protein K2K25_01690, partial [Muribaculaceae bacterium]|nr:hypothetical protein [Muribaculaceae bacterium]